MRAVRCAAGPIHEERLVGREGLVLAQPDDRVVSEVLAQMVVVVAARGVGMFDVGRVAHQARLILRRLPGQKAVEVFEAVAGGPVIERAGGGRLFGRRVVPLAPRAGVIAVVLEHLGDGGAALWYGAHVAIPVIGKLGDLTAGDAVMVAPGEQGRACGRTHGSRVEPVVGDPLFGDLVQGRSVDLAAVSRRLRGADIVDEHDENVRRILRQPFHGRERTVNRLLHRPAGNAAGRFGRKRQDLLRARRQRERRTQDEAGDSVERSVSHRLSPFRTCVFILLL